MTLPEIIAYFHTGGSYESFANSNRIAANADDVALYAQKPFGLNSKIELFSAEETAGREEYSYNGADFYSLFDLSYLLNAVKEAEKNGVDDIDLALRLLERRPE